MDKRPPYHLTAAHLSSLNLLSQSSAHPQAKLPPQTVCLFQKLHSHSFILEQPPPYGPRSDRRERQDPMGEPAVPVFHMNLLLTSHIQI